jgi:hypothetical protein
MNSTVLGKHWLREKKKKEKERRTSKTLEDMFFKKRPKSYNHLVLQYHIMLCEREKGRMLKKHR